MKRHAAVKLFSNFFCARCGLMGCIKYICAFACMHVSVNVNYSYFYGPDFGRVPRPEGTRSGTNVGAKEIYRWQLEMGTWDYTNMLEKRDRMIEIGWRNRNMMERTCWKKANVRVENGSGVKFILSQSRTQYILQ